MNRRHFLGLALATAVSPALAKKQSSQHSQPRILTLRHVHTDEKLRVTYRVGDRYQRDAMQKLNRFLRDYRSGDSTVMDPRLFDILYDIQNRLGNPDGEFEIFSAYRSPSTNAKLRKVSRRVAKHSLHMSGQAIDIRFEKASCRRVRDAALALQQGGVGYYSRSDFVHIDTGEVRRWGA